MPRVEVFFDGDCPLCAREIAMLERLDRRDALRFEDIAAPDFDAGRYGTDFDTLMARIHAVLPSGELVRDVEVFRRAYAAVGLGWLVAPTRWPILGPLSDLAYRIFAKQRLRLTGRHAASCENDRCVPRTP